MQFNPKEGGHPWTAELIDSPISGYDVVLMLDKISSTEDSGWMLELGINADGSVCGQITAHPGYDALASFICTQDTLTIQDNHGSPEHVISDAGGRQETKVWVVQGEHPFIPGCSLSVKATKAAALWKAASLVNSMLVDCDMKPDATPDNWEDRLAALQERRQDDRCDVCINECLIGS